MKDTTVKKPEAIALTFGKLTNKEIKEVESAVESLSFEGAQRAYFMYKLLLAHGQESPDDLPKDPKACSLIDLRNAKIVGSGWCEKCDGALGRIDE